MPKSNSARKAKKTFSLSRESLRYLEAMRRERKNASASSVLDELIRKQQEVKEMERISASIVGYYDSLTGEEVAENRAWGKFAESQFPDE